ncbi:hypothetical protein FOZ63_005909 [Perkinsus olseni]|uniref:Uncharacterized protein n=1 Tax=Perkinsus olseni TaxID=32597 RepID=A0A7J6ULP7_PEROL|nr:hypothetical protein FOZ62_013235 [Perkinsus olseni]KAF4757958.1 hypothetical protein FOZ63_005909 [Perkinsus olseni]
MSLCRFVVVSALGVIATNGIRTSGQSEMEAMRGAVSELARQVNQLTQRIANLSDIVRGGGVVPQLEGSIEVEENTCDLVDKEGNRMTIIFGNTERPNPIIATKHSIKHRIKKTRQFSRVERVEEALKHFAPVIPFSHLSDIDLAKLRSYLPVKENDREKCMSIFTLLANRPPEQFGKGVEWFTEFHWSAVDNAKFGGLISRWRD